MPKLFLGFAGRARSGKTSACEAIQEYCEELGLTCKTYSVSDLIVKFCVRNGRLPDKPREELSDDEKVVLIEVGREMRAKNERFWLDQIDVAMHEDDSDIALVPNIRYRNEVEWLQQRGGVLVKVVRLNENGTQYISPDRPANDISETDLDLQPADYYITSHSGEDALVCEYALTILHFLLGLTECDSSLARLAE